MTDKLPTLIALYSSQSGAGKSTAASWLAQFGYVIYNQERVMQRMIWVLLGELGYDERECSRMINDAPYERVSECGISTHDLIRTLTNEWGRACVRPDLWTIMLRKKLAVSLQRREKVVVDGILYPHEYDALRKQGFRMWKIDRPEALGTHIQHIHSGLLDSEEFDVEIANSSTRNEFDRKLMQQTGAPAELPAGVENYEALETMVQNAIEGK
jgi:hypothetical protein